MQARDVDYRCGEVNLRGYLAMDDTDADKRPACWCFTKGSGSASSPWTARFHQSRRRRLDDAHRAVQRGGRPPLLGVDAGPVR